MMVRAQGYLHHFGLAAITQPRRCMSMDAALFLAFLGALQLA